MGVGLVECDGDDCDEMIPDPPQPVMDKYGGKYCEECKQDVYSLDDEMESFVGNDNIEDTGEILDAMKEGKPITPSVDSPEEVDVEKDEENDEKKN